MSKIAIVYHSEFGHTEAQARYVQKGSNSVAGIKATLFKVNEVALNPEILNEYDAIIFGSPTYMGSVSAAFKEFMDKSSDIWSKQQWKDKVAAAFTNSLSMSGDKLNTLIQLNIFAMQHSMIWVGLGEIDESQKDVVGRDDAINRIGSSLGAMAQSDNKPADITPPIGDLRTAEILGIRVANVTKKLKN